MTRAMVNAAIYLVYIATSSTGVILLKLSGGPLNQGMRINVSPLLLIGGLLYLLSFVIWTLLVARLPLSVAFPSATGATIVVTTLAGFLIFGEPMTATKLGACAMVMAGVALLALEGG